MRTQTRNLCLSLSYDGSPFHGWQLSAEGPSIEGELQSALETILQEPVKLNACSRTDAGVHAETQVVNFSTNNTLLPLDKLHFRLNQLLPETIIVLEAKEVPEDFHATVDCLGKEYHYHVNTESWQTPHNRHYEWHYPYKLDLSIMRNSARALVGKHDFSAYCNLLKYCEYEDHVRELTRVDIIQTSPYSYRFEIEGKSFMYKMVRNIVGTLVYIGRGKLSKDCIAASLKDGCRTKLGQTAPACGLFLKKITYGSKD